MTDFSRAEQRLIAQLPCEKALGELVRLNTPFVRRIARRVTFGREPYFEEAVQDGLEALVIAIRRFDPSRGVRLLTYAGHGIKHYISREYNKSRSYDLGVTANGVRRGRGDASKVSRLDAPVGEFDGLTLNEVIPDERLPDLDASVHAQSLAKEARVALSVAVCSLEGSPKRPKDKGESLARRIGQAMVDGTADSNVEMAKREGVSRERVRQMRAALVERARRELGVAS